MLSCKKFYDLLVDRGIGFIPGVLPARIFLVLF